MTKIKCIAFDCFGTVFDMSSISRDEIKMYVDHVRMDNFTPFKFPESWWNLKSHQDSANGIAQLQALGYKCIALSNGDVNLIDKVSKNNGIFFDYIIDLAGKHYIYKPHIDAYRTIEKDLGFTPNETLMVTANPTFGDIEGSKAVGMHSQVIRQDETPKTIIELAEMINKGLYNES